MNEGERKPGFAVRCYFWYLQQLEPVWIVVLLVAVWIAATLFFITR